MRKGRQDNGMEWAEAERQVKALMEKHGYRTMEGVPAKIDWEGREHLLDIRVGAISPLPAVALLVCISR